MANSVEEKGKVATTLCVWTPFQCWIGRKKNKAFESLVCVCLCPGGTSDLMMKIEKRQQRMCVYRKSVRLSV